MKNLFKCMIKRLNWIHKIHVLTTIKVFKFIYYLGTTLHVLKRYKEALRMYEKAIKLDPQDSYSYINKGLINPYII